MAMLSNAEQKICVNLSVSINREHHDYKYF